MKRAWSVVSIFAMVCFAISLVLAGCVKKEQQKTDETSAKTQTPSTLEGISTKTSESDTPAPTPDFVVSPKSGGEAPEVSPAEAADAVSPPVETVAPPQGAGPTEDMPEPKPEEKPDQDPGKP